MSKIKKDFWDMSWNPVWGCKNKCEYCYACKIAWRFADKMAKKEMKYMDIKPNLWPEFFQSLKDDLKNFHPTWLESNYVRKFPKKPSIIFVNSMSDPAYWKQSWYEKILKRITENFQHTFVVLTKSPKIYKKYFFPHNTILGVSITKFDFLLYHIDNIRYLDSLPNKWLISFEPIQENILPFVLSLTNKLYFNWIHVGQESGNRKNKIKATPEMIKPFYDIKDTAVFMKENIRGIYHPDLKKEFPA